MSDTIETVVIESLTDVINTFETTPPKGSDGADGIDAASAIPGSVTGDFLRWNETDNAWEVKSEPIEFNQIVLTPSVAAVLNQEGGLWYDSVGKSVMVCTDV